MIKINMLTVQQVQYSVQFIMRASLLGNSDDNKKMTISYAIHMHPMTKLQTPDIVDSDKNSFIDITCEILYAAIPMILNFVTSIASSMINLYLIGNHEDSTRFNGLGLGILLSNIFGYLLIENIGVCFSIICSYFEERKEVGFLYQKTLGIAFGICILITPVFYLMDKLTITLGFSTGIVEASWAYIWALIPSFYIYAFYDITKNYLYSENIIYPQLIISSCAVVVHLFLAYCMIILLNMGIVGAAWAKNISDSTMALGIYFYICWWKPTKDSWIEWDIRSLSNVPRYIQQIVNHQSFAYFQVLPFQIFCLIACNLNSEAAISAHLSYYMVIILLQTGFRSLAFCLNRSLSLSIEDDDIKMTKKKISFGITIVLFLTMVAIVNLYAILPQFSYLLHPYEEIAEWILTLFPLLIFFMLLDGLQLILIGIIKTLQIRSIWKLQILGHYVIGLGLSSLLCFYFNYQLKGLWVGFIVGKACNVIIQIKTIKSLNWESIFAIVRNQFKKIEEGIRKSTYQLSNTL